MQPMTTQPDPTIRERLRELAVRAQDDGATSMSSAEYAELTARRAEFRGATKPSDILRLLDELDTLERRVRAAETDRYDMAAAIDDAFLRSSKGQPWEGAFGANRVKHERRARSPRKNISEARSLISGTEE